MPSHPAPQVLPLPLVFINLDEDTQRRSAIEAACAAAGIAAERLAATRWTRLAPAQQAALYSAALNARQYFRPLLPGEMGCYASHIAAWRQLLASAAPALVVLEDDVKPAPGLADAVRAIAALAPDWDMVKLIGRAQEHPATRRPLGAHHELIAYRRVPSLTAGYVVSRRGSEKLLATRVPFGRPIDEDLRHWWEGRLVLRGVLPAAIEHADTGASSSIGVRQRETRVDLRFRKFLFKCRYTLANQFAREA
jgi:glycosyl transferase, family 25